MSIKQPIEPILHDLKSVVHLPTNRPYLIADCDGTLTSSDQLLLATFVLDKTVDIGDPVVRANLGDVFRDYKQGKLRYEKYLDVIGKLYAEMLGNVGETREHMIEYCSNWFDTTGKDEVQEYAAPMMQESEEFRMHRLMLTGAPGEIALPIARHIGIENVCAMMADVDKNGVYTGRMRDNCNTGITDNKSKICRAFGGGHAVAAGAGDQLSDTTIMETAVFRNKRVKSDLLGQYFLMTADPELLAVMMQSAKQHKNNGELTVIDKGAERDQIMELIREGFVRILKRNHKRVLLHEFEGVKPMNREEIKSAGAKRDEMEYEWD